MPHNLGCLNGIDCRNTPTGINNTSTPSISATCSAVSGLSKISEVTNHHIIDINNKNSVFYLAARLFRCREKYARPTVRHRLPHILRVPLIPSVRRWRPGCKSAPGVNDWLVTISPKLFLTCSRFPARMGSVITVACLPLSLKQWMP